MDKEVEQYVKSQIAECMKPFAEQQVSASKERERIRVELLREREARTLQHKNNQEVLQEIVLELGAIKGVSEDNQRHLGAIYGNGSGNSGLLERMDDKIDQALSESKIASNRMDHEALIKEAAKEWNNKWLKRIGIAGSILSVAGPTVARALWPFVGPPMTHFLGK